MICSLCKQDKIRIAMVGIPDPIEPSKMYVVCRACAYLVPNSVLLDRIKNALASNADEKDVTDELLY